MAVKFSIRALLDAGLHFGHKTSLWNPKMRRFIYTSRNKIHIIDSRQTLQMLRSAYHFVRKTVSKGGRVLFVGTKRQAVEIVLEEAARCEQFYVCHRWLGGTLTNWMTVRESIRRLKEMERMKTDGTLELLPKKEGLSMESKREKLNRTLGGIKDMTGLPNIVVVADANKEAIAIREANKLGIPVVALVDTNCNPDNIDWVVPGNDDAIRSLRFFFEAMADAVLEGMAMTGEEEDLKDDRQKKASPVMTGEDEEMVEVSELEESELEKLKDKETGQER